MEISKKSMYWKHFITNEFFGPFIPFYTIPQNWAIFIGGDGK